MRITNGMQIARTLLDQNRNLQKFSDYNNDMSSRTTLHRPSDDPVRVSRAMRLTTELSVNSMYKSGLNDSVSWTKKTDDSLNSIAGMIERIRELTVQASQDTVTGEDKRQILAEIQKIKDAAVNAGNDDYMGRYQFSGFDTDKKFVNEDGSYNTELNLASLPYERIDYNVGVGQKTPINFSGVEVFGSESYRTSTRAKSIIDFNNKDEVDININCDIALQKYKDPKKVEDEEIKKAKEEYVNAINEYKKNNTLMDNDALSKINTEEKDAIQKIKDKRDDDINSLEPKKEENEQKKKNIDNEFDAKENEINQNHKNRLTEIDEELKTNLNKVEEYKKNKLKNNEKNINEKKEKIEKEFDDEEKNLKNKLTEIDNDKNMSDEKKNAAKTEIQKKIDKIPSEKKSALDEAKEEKDKIDSEINKEAEQLIKDAKQKAENDKSKAIEKKDNDISTEKNKAEREKDELDNSLKKEKDRINEDANKKIIDAEMGAIKKQSELPALANNKNYLEEVKKQKAIMLGKIDKAHEKYENTTKLTETEGTPITIGGISVSGKYKKSDFNQLIKDLNKQLDEKIVDPEVRKSVSFVNDDGKISLVTANNYSGKINVFNSTVDTKEQSFMPYSQGADFKDPEREEMPFFEMIDRISEYLGADDSKGLSRMLNVVDYHSQNNLKIQGKGGARTKMYSIMLERTEDVKLNYSDLLSKTRDTDYQETSMQMMVAQYVYRASLAVTAKIIQPSLVDFLR